MPGKLLLDTNVVIALFAGDAAVQSRLAAVMEVFTPAIVMSELYFGAGKSGRAAANIQRVEASAAANVVFACNAGTAREYGLVKNARRVKGRPLPENDVWIAALARQHSLVLLSRDAHFHDVDGLSLEIW